MKSEEKQRRMDLLEELLQKLSEDPSILYSDDGKKKVFNRLKEIYLTGPNEDRFRHLYSSIFSRLTIIDQKNNAGSLDILSDNIRMVNKLFGVGQTDTDSDASKIAGSVVKLYDHVSLDIARINYIKNQSLELHSLSAQFDQQIKTTLDVADQHIENAASKERRKNERDQKDIQRQSITILGIFASIVLTFTGGFSFSKSIMENLGKVPIDQLLLITLVAGVILFDITAFLLGFIWMFNKKYFPGKLFIKRVNGAVLIGVAVVCFWGFSSKGSFKSVVPPQPVSKQTASRAVSSYPSVTNHLTPNASISPQPVTNQPALHN